MQKLLLITSIVALLSGCNLSVNVEGEGSVKVQTSNSTAECDQNSCNYSLPFNSAVTLTPVAAEGSVFIRWQGQCGLEPVCTLTSNANKSDTAIFRPIGVEAEMARMAVLADIIYANDFYSFYNAYPPYNADLTSALTDKLPQHLQVDSLLQDGRVELRSSYGSVIAKYFPVDSDKVDFCRRMFFDTVRYDSITPRAAGVLNTYYVYSGSSGGSKMTGAPTVFGSTVLAFLQNQLHGAIDLNLSDNALLAQRIGQAAVDYRNDFRSTGEIENWANGNCSSSFTEFRITLRPPLARSFTDAAQDLVKIMTKLESDWTADSGYPINALSNLTLTSDDAVLTGFCSTGNLQELCMRNLMGWSVRLNVNASGLLYVYTGNSGGAVDDGNAYQLLRQTGELAKSTLGLSYRILSQPYEGDAANIPASAPMGVQSSVDSSSGLRNLYLYLWHDVP